MLPNKTYTTILKRRKIDNIRASNKGGKPPVNLDEPITFKEDNKTTKLDQLGDHKPSPMEDLEERDLIEKIKEHINNDPAFDHHPKAYPQATCREIIKRRLLTDPPQEWQDLAQDLNIPYGTVTAHYNRKCLPRLANLKNKF